jgi:exosortase/archaeosortase family protein
MFKFIPIIQFSQTLSKEVISFSFRALSMLIIWVFLDQILIIDYGIMTSLQYQGVFILNKLTHLDFRATQVQLYQNSAAFSLICENIRLNVGKNCDGKSLMFMYLSFILIYPGIQFKSRLIYVILGLILIHEFNVMRVVFLSVILKHDPHNFPMMHKYFFQVVMYALIFLLVRHFIKNQPANASQ